MAETRTGGGLTSPGSAGGLTPHLWQRVKEIVADALDRPPAARAEFIDRACGGDAALRHEVESMLRQADETWIDDAVGALTRHASSPSRVGERVGDYRIVEEIGRGGMGAVYLAERADEQFQKRVAVKVLKRGTDTEEVLRRFQTERQIVARLEHPNIARLLDAGTTDDGLPFFVMEHVDGVRITDYCAQRQLDMRARIELFLRVCDAVQFAHRNLIVHRDLKPQNIFVTSDGTPKLLDFGIAKLLAPDNEQAQVTLREQQRLTPGYASPEQVRGEPVTTATDVYSLGALLYELLAGVGPHKFSTPSPAPTELFRVIAEQEPARASAAAKNADARRILRGDLDTILATALRKEPQRRYTGVTAFADDLRRYVDGRPVRARPSTFTYRASKFIRRNKVGVAAAVLVLLTLTGGIVATLYQAHQARLERARAERRFNDVRELARSVLFEYHDPIAALPGSTAVRQKLVADALKYLDRISQERTDDISLLRELADAYERVAAVQGGVTVARDGTVISSANLGDVQGAIASQRKAVALREVINSSAAGERGDTINLARALAAFGGLHLIAGQPEAPLTAYTRARELLLPVIAADGNAEEPRALFALVELSMAKVLGSPGVANLGDPQGALAKLREAIAAYEQLAADFPENRRYQQSLMNVHNSLGLLHHSLGQQEEQLAANIKAAEIGRRLVQAEPHNLFFRKELAVQLGNIGSSKRDQNDPQGALPFFHEALAIYEDLAAADPNDASTARQWAVAHRNVGVATGASDPETATRHLARAREILAQLVARNRDNFDVRRQLAFTSLATSRYQLEANDATAATSAAETGIAIAEPLVAEAPAEVSARSTLAMLYAQLGACHAAQAELLPEASSAAKEAYRKAAAVYEQLQAQGRLTPADAARLEQVRQKLPAFSQ